MITSFVLFIGGIAIGYGYHWLHSREAVADLRAELAYANSIVDALHADNAELVTIIESHKSPWG